MLLIIAILLIAIVLMFVFIGYLLVILNEDTSNGWDEVKVKRSELNATVQRYGLNSEEELREYLWFNCGTVLIVENDNMKEINTNEK